ncbi:tRNA lysidine(34) synthetase TilS [Leeuwenhoekiella aestuarii]|uniref:tRNA lysidine(34) synthetase TilS n=1 Tax=Leeuwenhoekiella aestuarii TaxID=2249426 RepID=UPI000FFF1DE9|nr:tRNA lysidine(34) synthetase TilS [Leeuwenhoekiella aestuarii]
MITAFKEHLESQFFKLKNKRVLLAVSGGLDSVVLAHLFSKNDWDFEIAHCNFSLRGKESDADAVFVEQLAANLNVKFHIQKFDTEAFAKAEKVSTQMAARELRYTWFEEVCIENQLSYVVTAHHAKDDLETFLINLSRGSGIEGFTGMEAKGDFIIRPLLPFSREEIAKYAQEHNIKWREDSSNSADKYLRNHLRHHAIPALEEAAPQFLTQFKKSQQHLQESANLLEDYTALLFSKIVTQSFKGYDLNIAQLKATPNTKAVLYQLLKNFDFTAWDDIYELLDAQPGKYVASKSYRLIKDRDVLILIKNTERENSVYKFESAQHELQLPDLKLKKESVHDFKRPNTNEAYFDLNLLEFPLMIRKWEEGDTFYPFGMKGKKKLSKFFKDLKYSTIQKEAVWLLCSQEDIIWVIGERTDDRYKINSTTSNLVKFTAEYD